MRLFAVLAVIIGGFMVVDWGILGRDPFKALSPSPTLASGSGGGSAGSPDGSAAPSTASGYQGFASLFGVKGTFSGFGESVGPTVAHADAAGLAQFGATLWHDLDYGAAAGQYVMLPPDKTGKGYQFLGDSYDARWGHLLYFRAPNGGVFGLPHLDTVPFLMPGESYNAGFNVGRVGGTYDFFDPAYWTGPHLAIIADSRAADWLQQQLGN